MDVDIPTPFLESVAGETSFFRSITRSRPVGIHRYFHVLSMQQTIKRETGEDVSLESLWSKLESCYDLDALEGLEIGGYDSSDSDSSQPHSIPSPVPGENLTGHAHFRNEFELPWAEYDPLMALRRVSDTSPPASPITLPRRKTKGKVTQNVSDRAPSRRGSLMAGLVGGDSDSSALTESGDEHMDIDVGSAKPSRRNSVMTGTPTEGDVEEEDEDLAAGESPVASSSTRGRRGRRRGTPASRRPAGTRRTTRKR